MIYLFALLELTAFAMPPEAWRNLATRRLNSYMPCLAAIQPYVSDAYRGHFDKENNLALMALPSGSGVYIFTDQSLGSKIYAVDFSRIPDANDRNANCYTFTIPAPIPRVDVEVQIVRQGDGYVFRDPSKRAPLSCYKIDQTVEDVMRSEAARASGASEFLGGQLGGALKSVSRKLKLASEQDPAVYPNVVGSDSTCRRSLALTNNVDLLDGVAADVQKLTVKQGAKTGIRRYVQGLRLDENDPSARKDAPLPGPRVEPPSAPAEPDAKPVK